MIQITDHPASGQFGQAVSADLERIIACQLFMIQSLQTNGGIAIMDEYRRNNRSLWNEYARIHSHSAFYRVDEFKTGENSLNEPELTEVGDVAGKSLLHLQCHFGQDTLSWARLGAQVTGVDFSDEAVRIATSLSQELNIPARFICCDLYESPQHLEERFDIVYTSYGVLAWLPDLMRWAQVAAHFLKPGGTFYIAEFHPFAVTFDDEAPGLIYRHPYFKQAVEGYEVKGSYADRDAKVQTKISYEWDHTLGEIVSALAAAGLHIEYLHEFPFSRFEQLACLKNLERDTWGFPGGAELIPLMFSIRAVKPG